MPPRCPQVVTSDQPAHADLRHKVYVDVCNGIVNENVFSQYAYKSLPTSTHLWAFKKQLCSQMALSGEAAKPRMRVCVGGGPGGGAAGLGLHV